MKHAFQLWGALALAVSCTAVQAQTQGAAAPASVLPRVAGATAEGQKFDLTSLRGKVVMLMYWSTDCAVCRDKMPELRQNMEGWQGKPFALVLVSTDRRLQDLQAYAAIIARTVPPRQRFVQLWSGDPAYADNVAKGDHLPLTLLIDKAGREVARFQGRLPPEVWDQIAEML